MWLAPDLLRHNAWANRTVLDCFKTAPQALDVICYDGDPLRTRLQHQLGVERAFLDVLRGTPARPNPPGDLDAILVYAAENAAGLASVVEAQGEGGQERSHFVPWFKTEFPQHVLISQLLAHSAQHRSELAWELARTGVSTSELDFIVWVAGGRPEPGDKPSFPGGPQQ